MTTPERLRPAGLRGAKFGARPAHALTFAEVFDPRILPTPPASFGHYRRLGPIGMLGNDRLSTCVPAMAAHRVMYWRAGVEDQAIFDDASVVATYREVSPYSPFIPFSDQGTDMSTFPDHWQRVGILDAAGQRHRIDLWVTLEIGDWKNFVLAMWLCDGADLGVALPRDAEAMFSAGKPWHGANHGPQGDGHGIAGFGINSHGDLVVGTWGALQAIDREWWSAYTVWLDAPISIEALDRKGLSPEQYDREAIEFYVRKLRQ